MSHVNVEPTDSYRKVWLKSLMNSDLRHKPWGWNAKDVPPSLTYFSQRHWVYNSSKAFTMLRKQASSDVIFTLPSSFGLIQLSPYSQEIGPESWGQIESYLY